VAGTLATILVTPGHSPFWEPTKSQVIINLRSSTALGLDIPASLLARADEVIE